MTSRIDHPICYRIIPFAIPEYERSKLTLLSQAPSLPRAVETGG